MFNLYVIYSFIAVDVSPLVYWFLQLNEILTCFALVFFVIVVCMLVLCYCNLSISNQTRSQVDKQRLTHSSGCLSYASLDLCNRFI